VITQDEVFTFGDKWFETVTQFGTAQQQSAFFTHESPRIYVMSSGISIDMIEHEKLHQQWINEEHGFGEFTITPLSNNPERVRAAGTVYWQASQKINPTQIIKAIVGEDWIIERRPEGDLAFVLYMNTFHHLLPESAPLQLQQEPVLKA
jgi:hypothetical protein